MDIEYFMDKCTVWEIDNILDCITYVDRNLWESSRLNAFITARANFKGIKTYQDVCKFKWEQIDAPEEHIQDISNDDINRLKQLAKQWEDKG